MKQWLACLIVISTLYACGPKTIYKESREIPGAMWKKDKPLTFGFEVNDTLSKYDIVLSVKYKNDFRYKNQYISVTTTFPNNKKIEDIVSLELSKNNGDSNGKCSGESCIVPILFQEKINFPSLGHYIISIAQYSREDSIMGIESMEFKLMESGKIK
jgi:gliding motility-associated lipoprotein GldH